MDYLDNSKAPICAAISGKEAALFTSDQKAKKGLVSVNDFQIEEYMYSVIVDGKGLEYGEVEELAENDGFDTVEEFLTYFEGGFEGKIIHWTNDFTYAND